MTLDSTSPTWRCSPSSSAWRWTASSSSSSSSSYHPLLSPKQESVLTPAFFLEELVFAEEGKQSWVEKYLRSKQQQKQQLQQELSRQSSPLANDATCADEDDVFAADVCASNDDNNNVNNNNNSDNSETRVACNDAKVNEDQVISSQSRPRTYSIESLLGHREPQGELSRWMCEDPMWWNENLYIEIDNDDDCGAGTAAAAAAAAAAATAKEPDISEDIFSLFPFPLSISSPPLPDALICANDGGVKENAAISSSQSTTSPTINSSSSSSSTKSPPLLFSTTSSSSSPSSSFPVPPISSLPDFIFPDEEEALPNSFADEREAEVDEETCVEDDDDDDDDDDDAIVANDVADVIFLCGDAQDSEVAAAAEVLLAMDVEEEEEEEQQEEEEDEEDREKDDVDGPLHARVSPTFSASSSSLSLTGNSTRGSETTAASEQQHKLIQQRKQQLQQQQQQQQLQRQRRQSLSRRQRRRRRSWTVVKPKIHRHSTLKNAKSPTRGLAISFQQQQQQNAHSQPRRLKSQRVVEFDDGWEEENGCKDEPVVSTSALPLDHQGLCKSIGEPTWKERTSIHKKFSKPKTVKNSDKERSSFQNSRLPLDAAVANKAREHLNIVERQRRFVLSQAMDKLRDELPYQSEDERRKLSKLEILRGAKEYINRLRLQDVALVDEKALLKEKQKQLVRRLKALSQNNNNTNTNANNHGNNANNHGSNANKNMKQRSNQSKGIVAS